MKTQEKDKMKQDDNKYFIGKDKEFMEHQVEMKQIELFESVVRGSDGLTEITISDKDGKKLFSKDSDGNEEIFKYDQDGKLVYTAISDEKSLKDQKWYEYDDKGNEIIVRGNWEKTTKEYDEKGQLINTRHTFGQEERYNYDEEGNLIHSSFTNDGYTWGDKWYDQHGKIIRIKNSEVADEYGFTHEYDEQGRLICTTDSYGNKETWEYDEQGRQTHYQYSDAYESWHNYSSFTIPQGVDLMKTIKERVEGLLQKDFEVKELEMNQTFKMIRTTEIDNDGNKTIEITVFDKNKKYIYSKNSKGVEHWSKYDDKRNEIYYGDSNGAEISRQYREYDDKGNKIHQRNSNGFEENWQYDDKGNEIYYRNSNGTEISTEYDDNGNKIHQRNSDGYEEWTQYDQKGNEIHFENSEGLQHWKDYDQNGNLVHYRDTNKLEYWSKFNEKGQEISRRTSEKLESWYEYDQRGNLIHASNSEGYQEWWKYNEDGKVTHYKDTDGDEKTWKYDEYGDLRTIEDSDGNRYSYNVKGDLIHSKHPRMFENWSEYLTLTIPQGVDLMKVIKEKVEQGFTKPQEKEQVYKIQKVTMNGSEGQRVVVEVRNQENNVVYFKGTNGDEVWYDYNDMGKLAHLKTSFGREEWHEYDQNGKEIHFRDNFGVKRSNVYEYDEKGRIIFHIHPDDCQDFYNYDENGGYFVSRRDPDGKFLSVKEYDQKGNITYSKNDFGDVFFCEYEYNDLGQKTYCKHSKGEQEWWEYNANGKVAVHTSSFGYVESHEYDEKGNEIHYKESHGEEIWSKYDKDGNLIHSVDNLGEESKYEYSTITIPQGVDLMEAFKERVEQELAKPQGEKMQDEQTYKVKKTIEVDYNSGNKTTIQILNANNQVLYAKDSTGYEEWRQYDDKGNEIHFENSRGYVESHEYDEKGNKIHERTSEGFEESWQYDKNGQLIHYKNSQGAEEWLDKNNNLTYCKENDGVEYWYEYSSLTIPNGDLMEAFKERVEQELAKPQKLGMLFRQIIIRKSNGDLKIRINNESNEPVYHWDSGYYGLESFYTSTRDGKSYTKFNDFESWKEHDENGNEIYYKDSDGLKIWREYDKDGREVHFREEGPEGHYEQQYDYSPDGRVVHSKDSDGYEEWHEYDEKGNEVYYKNSLGEQYWQEYDQNGNKINYNSSDGVQQHWKYDDRGNKVSYIFTEKSNISEFSYAYDQDGRLVSERKNENGKLIYDMVCSFDEHGNLVYQMKSTGETKEEMYQEHVYDDKARILHTKRTFSDGGQCDIWNRWEEGCDKPFVTKRTIYPINYKDPINGKEKTGFEKTEEYDDRGNLLSYSDSLEEHQYSSSVEEFSLPRGCDIMEAIKERIGGLKQTFTEERIRDAWQIAASNLRLDVGEEYNLKEKLNIMNQYLLEKDYYHLPNDGELKNIATVLRGIDAIEHGVDSLDFTRQDWSRMKESFLSHIKTKSWSDGTLQDIIRGYKEDNGVFPGTRVLRGTDSIFDNKLVAKQAEMDGQKLLLSGRDLTFPDNSNFENLKEIYIDTPSNRAVLDEYLREDFRLKSKKELSINERVLYVDGNVLKVAQVASVSEDDDSIHIRSVPAPIPQKSSQLLNQQVKLEDKRLIKDETDLYRYLAKNVGGEKGFVISDSVRLGGYKGLIKIEPVNNISLQPKFDGKEVIRSCVVECADNNWKFDLRSGQDKLENTTIEANTDKRVHFVTDIDSAVKLVKDISDMGFDLSHYFEYAVNNPKEVFLEIKDYYYGVNYKIDPYIEGLAKTNKENHYLDELLYESCIESNESLFEKLVNAGADLSWRRNECGKSCNILHYTAADLLTYATELVIERLVKDGKVDLLTEMLNEDNFENLSPNEVWKLRVEDVKELDDGVHYARDLHFLASQKIDEQHEGRQQLENSLSMSKTEEKDVVKDFLGKVKESLPDKVGIDELFKVSAIILDGYNKDEKASIGSYLAGIGADNKNNLGKFLSEVLDVKQDRTPPSRKTGGDNFSRER